MASIAATVLWLAPLACSPDSDGGGPQSESTSQISTRRSALTFTPYLPFEAGQTASIPQSFKGWCGATSSHSSPIHNSIDFTWPGCKGDPVLATAGGTVSYVQNECPDNGTKNCFNDNTWPCSCGSGLGNMVVIDHGDGVFSAYAHLNPGSITVAEDAQVCTGQHFADIGHTGFGSGAHLHFQFQDVPKNIYGSSGTTLSFNGFVEAPAPVCGSVTSQNAKLTGCTPPAWWCGCIADLKAEGLLSKECSEYSNGETFDRATFAKIVGDALDIEDTAAYTQCTNLYEDIDDDSWYENYVSALAHLEFDDGVSVWSTGSSTFNPGNSMTRCEGLKVIAEAWDLPASNAELPFSDLNAFESWCADYAKRALAAGVITSTTGAFGPNDPLTVGGAACMVAKTISSQGTPTPSAGDFVGCGCTNECSSSGKKECVGASGFRTCGNYDQDSCLEWGSSTSCGSGQVCTGAGACGSGPCSDECSSSGKKECVDASSFRACGNYDQDSCLEWGSSTSCGIGEVCTNAGTCEPDPCSDECSSSGKKECVGASGFRTCGNYDQDSCLEWGSSTSCASGQICSGVGVCGPGACSDECSPGGSSACVGSNAYQTCGNYDQDTCLEWSTATACAAGLQCQSGVCAAPGLGSCLNPIVVKGLPYSGSEDTSGADNVLWFGNDQCPGAENGKGVSAKEHVYKFTPTVSGLHEITASGFDIVLYVVLDCGNVAGTCVGAADSAGNNEAESLSVLLSAGTPAYLVVDGYSSSSSGAYQVSIAAPQASASCGGQCGAQAETGCGCDVGCSGLGDCCADFCQQCPEIEPDACGGCVPMCDGAECGDDGCGGSCGNCGSCEACSASGQCLPTAAACGGQQCGTDACGNSCGSCGNSSSCLNGQCVADCAPDCTGKSCGSDGCGGDCGICPAATPSCMDGACVLSTCVPTCSARECGADGCGGVCGTCPAAAPNCQDGACVLPTCVPTCSDRECGADGCGGVCGTCPAAAPNCEDGSCVLPTCVPTCSDRECGTDGCGGVCGMCPAAAPDCVAGLCLASAPTGDATTQVPDAGGPPSSGTPTSSPSSGCGVASRNPADEAWWLILLVCAGVAWNARTRRRIRTMRA